MVKLTKKRIIAFQRKIFDWWKLHSRDLPWRHTHDPYHILISEVMLQQTQVLRVVAKYREFIQRFPTVFELAQASPAVVLRIWKGMGYNRRALYLYKAAHVIVDTYHGTFPKREKELVKLPGLGKYTAAAILVFAYKQEVALVDTNIRQIITHFFFNDEPQKESVIEAVAKQLIPKNKSWEWHQALMDFGALRLRDVRRPFAQGKLSKKSMLETPFRQSNRFYRGRIIDVLRERDMTEGKLLKDLEKQYNKPEIFFIRIIESLVKDGLVQEKRGVMQLPT